MSIVDRKIKHREEVRASILEAARELVLKEGWQALSLRKIAEAIQYSVPVIYDHFINKEALLKEFVQQGFGLLNQQLKIAKGAAIEVEAQVKAIGNAYWNFANNNKEYYQLMYGLGMPSCETVKAIPELNEFTEIIFEPLQQLISHSANKANDAMVKFKSFWTGLHGLVSIDIMNISGKRVPNEKVLEDFLNTFLAGMKA